MSRFLAVALMLLFVLVPAQLAAEAEIDCRRVAFSPVLDGRLDDWPRLPQAAMAESEDWRPAEPRFAEYGGPEDISAEIRVAWDNQALYVTLDTRDDELVRVRSVGEIDRGDSIVLAFAADGAEEGNQFVVALLKAASLVWRTEPAAGAGEVRTIGRALWARPEEDGGTRVSYELAIPWAELESIRAIPGARFTATFSVCDDDGEGLEGCLERSIVVTLSAGGVATSAAPLEPVVAPSLTPVFPAPNVARFDDRCFTFQERDTLLVGGEVEYARLPRTAWKGRLKLLRSAGLNAVGVTAPWSHHQPTPESADLRDLRDFLAECTRTGVWVQLNVGPYAGENWEAGGVPAWASGTAPGGSSAAVEGWYEAVLPVAAEYQVSAGGPVAVVVARPLPDETGAVEAAELEALSAQIRAAGVIVPILTVNARGARANRRQSLANVLDTISFYSPPTTEALVPRLKALAREENGPAAIAALPGDYRSASAARRSVDAARVALANEAAGIILSDFAPGVDARRLRAPGDWTGAGIIEASGACTAGYGEARLLGGFLRQFGAALARAVSAPALVEVDAPAVRATARLGAKQGFIFVWNEDRETARQVRLRYLEPGSSGPIGIPQAGSISLPPGATKIMMLDVPLGRAELRYTTSEVLCVHRLGGRTVLVVYGDADTAGEIALRLPGPPLVSGEVRRQHWDPESNTLVLDYYHGADDQYVLVDELQICILSRARAAMAGTVREEGQGVTFSAGVHVADGALSGEGVRAVLDCPEGIVRLSAALPEQPTTVAVDGREVPFTFATPERVLRLDIETEPFEEGQRPRSLWNQIGRAIVGGPPKLYAEFDRGLFMPDGRPESGTWHRLDRLNRGAATDMVAGGFVRLRGRFEAAGSAEVTIEGSRDPMLVFVNDEFVPVLSGSASVRRSDITALLRTGGNRIEMVVHHLPRGLGISEMGAGAAGLPQVELAGARGEPIPVTWEICPALAGEAAGWAEREADTHGWHFVRFGPWREQGRDLADVRGVGWYRVPFGLPRSEGWKIPYRLRVTLHGGGNIYLNGDLLATCSGDGDYVLPLPTPPLRHGDENMIAAALYGMGPQTGLHWLEVRADEGRMTRQRVLEIRF